MTAAALRPIRPALAHDPEGALWMEVAGVTVSLRRSGALWLESEGVLAVADLHLEKGSAYASRGQLLPPYDTAATLQRLEAEVAALSPRVLVLLGDSFHDARAVARLAEADRRRIAELGLGRSLVWVVGNHDREGLEVGPDALPGERADAVRAGGLNLRHEPASTPALAEAAGHLHPCAKVVGVGGSVRRRCFLTDGRRLILPAFGAYAGGLNARDVAFTALFARPPIAAALGGRRVHPIPFGALAGD